VTADSILSPAVPDPKGLVIDWGGVLTPPLSAAMAGWAARDGVELDHFYALLRPWTQATPSDDSPVQRLERGELSPADFERQVCAAMAELGSPCSAEGLLRRMLADLVELDEAMLQLIRDVRATGAKTVLLSNSWGDHYPALLWDGLFDSVVISGRVGMRKPEPRIFAYAADQVGLSLAECVMVDDVQHNLDAASGLGMIPVLHRDPMETTTVVEGLFGLTRNRPT